MSRGHDLLYPGFLVCWCSTAHLLYRKLCNTTIQWLKIFKAELRSTFITQLLRKYILCAISLRKLKFQLLPYVAVNGNSSTLNRRDYHCIIIIMPGYQHCHSSNKAECRYIYICPNASPLRSYNEIADITTRNRYLDMFSWKLVFNKLHWIDVSPNRAQGIGNSLRPSDAYMHR